MRLAACLPGGGLDVLVGELRSYPPVCLNLRRGQFVQGRQTYSASMPLEHQGQRVAADADAEFINFSFHGGTQSY